MSETVTTGLTDEEPTDDVSVPVGAVEEDPTHATESTQSARVRVDRTAETTGSGRLWRVFACVGLASVVAAVVVATVPGLVESLADAGTTATLRAAIPVAAVGVALVGLYGVVSRDHSERRDSGAPVELPTVDPESKQGPEQTVVGAEIDDVLDRIDGRVDPYDGLEASYAADVRRRLRKTVERTLIRRTDMGPDEARAAVEDGTWTEDRRAASFVGGDRVADPSLGLQLRDWASGEGFDRSVDATIEEIRRLRGGASA